MKLLKQGFDAKGCALELGLAVSTVYHIMRRKGYATIILSSVERDELLRTRRSHADAD